MVKNVRTYKSNKIDLGKTTHAKLIKIDCI